MHSTHEDKQLIWWKWTLTVMIDYSKSRFTSNPLELKYLRQNHQDIKRTCANKFHKCCTRCFDVHCMCDIVKYSEAGNLMLRSVVSRLSFFLQSQISFHEICCQMDRRFCLQLCSANICRSLLISEFTLWVCFLWIVVHVSMRKLGCGCWLVDWTMDYQLPQRNILVHWYEISIMAIYGTSVRNLYKLWNEMNEWIVELYKNKIMQHIMLHKIYNI